MQLVPLELGDFFTRHEFLSGQSKLYIFVTIRFSIAAVLHTEKLRIFQIFNLLFELIKFRLLDNRSIFWIGYRRTRVIFMPIQSRPMPQHECLFATLDIFADEGSSSEAILGAP